MRPGSEQPVKVEVPRHAVEDEVRVDAAKTALVVIDMQNDFVQRGAACSSRTPRAPSLR
jgi:hypothetical protein